MVRRNLQKTGACIQLCAEQRAATRPGGSLHEVPLVIEVGNSQRDVVVLKPSAACHFFVGAAGHGSGRGIQVLEEILARAVTDVGSELVARVQEGVRLKTLWTEPRKQQTNS